MRFGSALQTTFRGRDQLAALDLDTLARKDPLDADPAGQGRAGLECRLGDRKRDPSHAPLDIAPHGSEAEQVPLMVHEVNRRGAGVPRARVGPDDPLAHESILEPLVSHIAIERFGDRFLEHDRDQLAVAAQDPLDLGSARRGATPGVPGGALSRAGGGGGRTPPGSRAGP